MKLSGSVFRMHLLFLLLTLAAACSGGGSNDNNSNPNADHFSLGYSQSAQLRALSQSDLAQMCSTISSYIRNSLGQEKLCSLAAVFLTAFLFDDSSENGLVHECQLAQSQCARDDIGYSCPLDATASTESCEATVGELEACLLDSFDAIESTTATISCETFSDVEQVRSSLQALQEVPQSANCEIVRAHCPGLLNSENTVPAIFEAAPLTLRGTVTVDDTQVNRVGLMLYDVTSATLSLVGSAPVDPSRTFELTTPTNVHDGSTLQIIGWRDINANGAFDQESEIESGFGRLRESDDQGCVALMTFFATADADHPSGWNTQTCIYLGYETLEHHLEDWIVE